MTNARPVFCVLGDGLVQVGSLAFDLHTGEVKMALHNQTVDVLMDEARKKNGGKKKPDIIVPTLQVVPRNGK